MKRTVGIGHQDFEYIRLNNLFYIDKTSFLAQWWQSNDSVTLITRPRRFGKTLNMSMTEKFFSLNYSGRKDLFEGLLIWEQEAYRKLQGTYPVITFSFANIKEKDYSTARRKICQILSNLYSQYNFICHSDILDNREKEFFESVSADMDDVTATMAVHQLALFLHRYYNKKVIILLDEYDTPMQEAYVNGYWEEITGFMRSMLNATFKTNPYMERAIMTGITRITKESIFSDLNNLKVITTTSEKYADCFGFTEQEVFSALDEFGLSDRKEEVKEWYDGFTFGNRKDIYNPWSVLN
ncbi:MAG: AAA family ATPase, partial [Lachnospiraceae bacterium]|nr:AAA family ATPase [Lachnospiraceae bacterium]